jgi:hypothetical protein
MYRCLRQGGSVALTDFEDFGLEARRFHGEPKAAGAERYGISREGIKVALREAGFVVVKIEIGFEMGKEVESSPGVAVIKGEKGTKMMFPFLVCIGKEA